MGWARLPLRLFFTLAITHVLSALSIGSPGGLSKRELDKVTFLHVNDIHSRLIPALPNGAVCPLDKQDKCVGGWARLLGLVKHLKARDPEHTLWVNLGDDSSGTAFYSDSDIETMASYLNEADLDAWVIGNHEFDRGDDDLWALISRFSEKLRKRVLGGNIHFNGNSDAHAHLKNTVREYIPDERNRLVMFGISPFDTYETSKPSDDVRFEKEVAAVRRILGKIKEDPEVRGYRIIGLTHVGYEMDKVIAKEFAKDGLTAIIGGHSHTGLDRPKPPAAQFEKEYRDQQTMAMHGDPSSRGGYYPTMIDNVCVVQAAMYGRYLGQLELTFDGTQLKNCEGTFYEITSEFDNIADPGMTEIIRGIQNKLPHLEKKIGSSSMLIEKGNRFQVETTAGNWNADVIYTAAKEVDDDVKFAFLPGGSVTADIPEGDISGAQLSDIEPYGERIGIWEMRGKEIWELIEGVYSRKNPKGEVLAVQAFLHYSQGVKVVFDRSEHSRDGNRLKSLRIGDDKISMYRPTNWWGKYKFATTKWLLDGKENFFTEEQVEEAKKEAKILGEVKQDGKVEGGLKDAMHKVIDNREGRPISSKLEGRILSEHPWVLNW